MDKGKTGRYIAARRRAAGLTQEQLGELLGISYKTVSRWERGVYMPDIEMLEALAKAFSVTVDEIIAGEDKINAQSVVADNVTVNADDANVKPDTDDASQSAFTVGERAAYFKRKWLHDHIAFIVTVYVVIAAVGIFAALRIGTAAAVLTAFASAAAAVYFRNSMMAYVEARVWK